MTTIGELCVRDVVTGTCEMTVAAAAKLMRQEHVGCVVIVDKANGGLGVPLGIVTDRDIVLEVTAPGLDANAVSIGSIKPRELVTARADKDALEALRLMRSKGVRRLPVVSENGSLLGIVAFDDLLELVAEQLSGLTKVISREQAREATTGK